MKQSIRNNQQGVAHLALVLMGVLVIAAVGFAGWRVMSKDKADNSLAGAINQASVKCDLDDKDLCKFFTSWKENKYYKISVTSTDESGNSLMAYEAEGKDKYHMVSSGQTSFEMISIGKTTYTKDPEDSKWWKQTLDDATEESYSLSDDLDFKEPADNAKEEDKTTYKKIGKEACGDLTCFKYQVIDPSVTDETSYIWFDDKDYQLRRMLSESTDKKDKTDMTFSYEKVTIKEPSPVKEVPKNQAVVPGSSEPMTVPSEAEVQQLMQQYGPQ